MLATQCVWKFILNRVHCCLQNELAEVVHLNVILRQYNVTGLIYILNMAVTTNCCVHSKHVVRLSFTIHDCHSTIYDVYVFCLTTIFESIISKHINRWFIVTRISLLFRFDAEWCKEFELYTIQTYFIIVPSANG